MINKDTICALATPAGGAIGVIRVSGPQTMNVASKVLRSARTGGSIEIDAKTTRRYCVLVDKDGHDIDDVVANFWHAPHGYTGEDSMEISCHGSRYILQQALQALIDAGCRQAEPGEYTMRAYLNGKMDLSQAEAVADLVSSTNRATHQLALSQMKGHFSSRLSALREKLLRMTSLLELELDFSDHEELEFADRSELLDLAHDIDDEVTRLAHSFRIGEALKQGIPVAIIGRTNVGKSTLLNALLHDDRAIVTDIPGTTRDTLEDTIDIHGVTFRFIDTAGLRHTTDRVEQIGIERTYQAIQRAAIILWLIDEEPTQEELADISHRCEGKQLLIVKNKSDLATSSQSHSTYLGSLPSGRAGDRLLSGRAGSRLLSGRAGDRLPFLFISAKYNLNLDALQDALYRLADIPEISDDSVIVTNARHYAKLLEASEALQRVLDDFAQQLSSDLIAEDLRSVLSALADITGGGQITPQETLNNIFRHFCVGK